MLAFLKGKVEYKSNNFVAINVNDVGYKVYMPINEIEEINVKDDIKVYTYLRMTEQDISLYGFLANEELNMFELLISVGGIGAKSAISILSNIEPSAFALAVITDDINTLKKLPGIGPKTAQRIVLELRDKIKTEQAEEKQAEIKEKIKISQNAQDAIDALLVLGYNRKDIEDTIAKINTIDMSVEEIIKEGLKQLGR